MKAEDIQNNGANPGADRLKVNTAKGISFVSREEILYVLADNKHAVIYLTTGRILETNHLLKWFEQNLPKSYFYRCHCSVIVNCGFIECVCGNMIILKGDHKVPISRNRKHPLENQLLNNK
jgi:two-component system, LytTR family, response regulator